MSSFQLIGLSPGPFSHLFSLSAGQLAPLGILRVTADSTPGFPCRVSLEDAEAGERLILLPFEHPAGAFALPCLRTDLRA